MPKIPISLEIEPELRPCPECFTKGEGGSCTDAPSTVDDFVEAGVCPTEMLSKIRLADTEWLEKLLKKHLAGMGGWSFLG